MTTMKVLKEAPISMSDLKHEMEKIKKRDKELSFRSARSEEYLNQFVAKDTTKLADTLRKLDISRLKEEYIIKIVDILPKSVEDLKVVLHGYTATLTKEHLQKIVDEVNAFLK